MKEIFCLQVLLGILLPQGSLILPLHLLHRSLLLSLPLLLLLLLGLGL